MNSSKWLYEMKVIAWTLVKLEKYFFKTDYIKNKLINYGSNVFSVNDGASCIKEIIETGFPAMVCRIGATELMVMNEYEKVCYNLQKDIPEKSVEQLVNWSGFFPKDIKYIEQFCELMKKSLNNANLIGVWGNPMEDYFVVKYAVTVISVPMIYLVKEKN